MSGVSSVHVRSARLDVVQLVRLTRSRFARNRQTGCKIVRAVFPAQKERKSSSTPCDSYIGALHTPGSSIPKEGGAPEQSFGDVVPPRGALALARGARVNRARLSIEHMACPLKRRSS